MNVLGIETSCDETAAAVVKDGRAVLSNIISSTLYLHKQYGGVVPEIAARGHLEAIDIVVRRALKDAGLSLSNIDLIALTCQPGLPGALLVGQAFAKALSFSLNLPLIEVDHTLAHIYAPFLDAKEKEDMPEFPFVGLVVSGGHTSLFYFKSFKEFKLLGQTRDDAIGEAFDKVGKILEFSYPGGPEIDRLAKRIDKTRLHFSCARLGDSFDFSFSGIKTAVLYFVRDWQTKQNKKSLPLKLKMEIAKAFQDSVVEVIIAKSISACKNKQVNNLVLGGGVAANSLLRKKMPLIAQKEKIRVYFARQSFCLDNAAMVAGLGYQMRRGK
ncbi:MAG: tRNA (adenosine(37)-N6)-threonylcarbamoyltransferase complex transferase subunit TsaD [Candidatus Omnitrophota bacterium]